MALSEFYAVQPTIFHQKNGAEWKKYVTRPDFIPENQKSEGYEPIRKNIPFRRSDPFL
jgi:hypothetical protein